MRRNVDFGMAGIENYFIANQNKLAADMRFMNDLGVVGRLRDADNTIGQFG